jgi:Cft2 family RNA processing exonuclease
MRELHSNEDVLMLTDMPAPIVQPKPVVIYSMRLVREMAAHVAKLAEQARIAKLANSEKASKKRQVQNFSYSFDVGEAIMVGSVGGEPNRPRRFGGMRKHVDTGRLVRWVTLADGGPKVFLKDDQPTRRATDDEVWLYFSGRSRYEVRMQHE